MFADFSKLLMTLIVWRIGLFVISFLAPTFLPYRPNVAYTNLNYYSPDSWVRTSFLTPWANFDGVHYFLIAKQGYDNEARFFPVYPLSMRLARFLTGVPRTWVHSDFILLMTGIVIAHVAFIATVFLLYKLIRLDFPDKKAFWICLFLIFFPTSFFFVSVYAESLLLLFSVAAFYAARKNLWFIAALCAALASATRIVGIFLWPALLLEYCLQADISWPVEINKIKKNICWLLLAPLGLMSFAFFNWQKWGRWNTFLLQQGDLGNSRLVQGIVNPLRVIVRYVRILIFVSPNHYEWWTALLEFFSFGLGLALIYFAWRKKIRPSYILYALACFFLPVLSGTLSGLPRYILVIFPFFLVLGMTKTKWLRYAMISFFALLSVVLTALFCQGYFVA